MRFILSVFMVSMMWVGAAQAAITPAIENAKTPEEKGLEIAREADRRDEGFGDQSTSMKMILNNAHGQSSVRSVRMKLLEVPDKTVGDKSISVFDTPADVKGTAFLSHTKILEPDDQWLYLPALKRIKRISSANKSGPFVGSEFAYEDLTSFEVGKWQYKYLRDEPCVNYVCFVIEQYPQYEDSGYTRRVAWVDQDEYRAMKVEYYDRKDSLLKTQTFSNYKQYLNKYWRAHETEMVNHQTGKSTKLIWDDYQFQMGLTDNDFEKNVLKRAE